MRIRRLPAGVAVVVAALALAACGTAQPAGSSTSTVSIPTTGVLRTDAGAVVPGPSPSISASGIDPGLSSYVTAATDDLAGRLGVSPGDIEVVTAAVVVWPDASLGCPQKGMSYAQVTQDGSLIELRVGPTTYRYHSGDDTPPSLCLGTTGLATPSSTTSP